MGGNDSLWKAGFYAPTTGGTFRGVFTEGNCATQFMPYSAYTMMSNPVKSSDSRDRNVEGDEINYTITQKIGKFYVDTMTPYSSLVMTDRLPEGLSYQSAAIYDGSGRDITSRGSLSYDESSRTVSFTMGASWLASIDNYSGQTLCLKIKTRVDPVETPLKMVKNSATTTIDKEVNLTSNEICDTLAIPYHAKYEYVCGTKGRKLPKEISTQSGAYQVSDESAYYQGDTVKRKAAPEDGTVYKVVDGDGEEKGSWVLQWDAETQKIDQSDVTFTGTWRYVPAPRLVIEKSISLQSDQLTEAHGVPCFLFRITGASSGKVWYRSIAFRSDSVENTKTAADGSEKIYRDQDGNTFRIDGDVLRASCPAIRLPEDDYLVEELDPLRFRAVQSESGYVGDFGWQQADTGADSAKISLRLSQLRPGEEGYDASYAKVSFKNEKIDWSRCSHTDLIINMLKKEAKR